MFEFMSEHAQLLNAVLNAAMVLVWVVYLQVFLSGHRRQARSVIHIDLGAAQGGRARCLITNLSSGALYVQDIVADLVREGHRSRMIVTDRDEIEDDGMENPLAKTNRGTLQPGITVDIGSLDDLILRARKRLGEDWRFDEIDSVKITVVAISGQAERIIGAVKEFRIEHSGQTVLFTASRVLTQQLRPLQTREEFDSILSERRFQ